MPDINIVTGHTGADHVTSDDARHFNAAVFGSGEYFMGFALSVVGASRVKVDAGDAVINGCHVRSAVPVYVDLQAGAAGYKRIDLVGIMYNNSEGVESAEVVAIQGTPTTETPVEPEYPSASILSGATQHFTPLGVVNIEGTAIKDIDQRKGFASTLSGLNTQIINLSNNIHNIGIDKNFSVTPTGGGRGLIEDYSGLIPVAVHCTQANVFCIPYGKVSNGWWCQFLVVNSNLQVVPYTQPVTGTAYYI